MTRFTLPALAAVSILALGASGRAQTLEDIRDEVRDAVRDTQLAASFGGLILLSDELELAGARYRIDDSVDTEITTFSLPFGRTYRPWGEDATGLYVEGVLGYARASQGTSDLYGGGAPGLETGIDTDWTTWGGLVGAGPEFRLGHGLTLTTLANVGLARIENDTDYSGPGAPATAAIFDGLAFNWDGVTGSAGGALRADWIEPLGDEHELEVVGRYDLRWIETFASDDESQEFRTRMQVLTLRADVTGPTGLHPFGRPLGWRAHAGFRHALEGELFGLQDIFLVGGSLELDAGETLPVGRTLSLDGGLIFGEDVVGYSIGLGFSF